MVELKILDETNISYSSIDNGLSDITCKCGCHFSATESDIEEQIIPIPYEKGINGVFGLGLSIVKKTLQFLNYDVTITNMNKGVKFIIK